MALRAVPDHPKFADLKRRLGVSKWQALGCLEAVWHFAGRFTPRGNIGKYADTAIEAWVEWDGEPGKMVEALLESGWLDRDEEYRLLVHDWAQHADNATKTAIKRANQTFCLHTTYTPSPQSVDESVKHKTVLGLPEPEPVPVPVPEPEPEAESLELSLLSAKPTMKEGGYHIEPPELAHDLALKPEDFLVAWNNGRGSLPKVEKLSLSRKKKLAVRIREGLTLKIFEQAVLCCRTKPFLVGQNDSGWTATFDWLIENDKNIEKAINNPYGSGRNENAKIPSGRGDQAMGVLAETLRRRQRQRAADENGHLPAGSTGPDDAGTLQPVPRAAGPARVPSRDDDYFAF